MYLTLPVWFTDFLELAMSHSHGLSTENISVRVDKMSSWPHGVTLLDQACMCDLLVSFVLLNNWVNVRFYLKLNSYFNVLRFLYRITNGNHFSKGRKITCDQKSNARHFRFSTRRPRRRKSPTPTLKMPTPPKNPEQKRTTRCQFGNFFLRLWMCDTIS